MKGCKLPQDAQLVQIIKGTGNKKSAYPGKKIIISLYDGYCSLGFRSDYGRVPAAYLRFWIEGTMDKTKRFTGKNIEMAIREFKAADEFIE